MNREGDVAEMRESAGGEGRAPAGVGGSGGAAGRAEAAERGETAERAEAAERAEFLGLSREELRQLLRLMLLSRRFEEKAAESYQMGRIGGFCHLYMGQEAVAAGTITPLEPEDYVISAYREHAQALVRGIDARVVMAELYGRVDGCSKGKGGSMHLFDRSINFMGGHAIVGGHIPLATGVGYAIRYRSEDRVCLCLFGDSAVNIGSFHESLNMAAKWRLPVLYVCENNSYGMGTDIRRVAAVKELVDRACSYEGMHAAAVNGMDVLEVLSATREAIRVAREEQRPSFLEIRCYRYMGHSMADPSHGTYRTKEEVERERSNDPIVTFFNRLREAGLMTEEEYEAMDGEVIREVEAAAEFAEASPRPDPSAVYEDIYADEYPDIARRDRWRPELS